MFFIDVIVDRFCSIDLAEMTVLFNSNIKMKRPHSRTGQKKTGTSEEV